MPRPQFSIRTLLWLTLVVALGCAFCSTARDWAWQRFWPDDYRMERHRRVVREMYQIEMAMQKAEATESARREALDRQAPPL
jgi:hypothetical protein